MTEKAGFAGPRADLPADVGDAVEAFGGGYVTGPDVGSGPADVVGIGRRARHVLCRPEAEGGSGDSSGPTGSGSARRSTRCARTCGRGGTCPR
ncbi:hypothetical protein KCV87_34110 [Actinosynnema pretiosum subsp. pretiosum]|uniref:Uncharacterized protein n=1 Tax=Actinosynnema pretiosum subsp. pretiosum TaxID=103721 RepID=A0AA45R3W8_9PSEU|nr:hypothetical protein KCV87_34110 [Actinosynnema pretiosum subsp. pretiosum]